jgi:hypothetical protein
MSRNFLVYLSKLLKFVSAVPASSEQNDLDSTFIFMGKKSAFLYFLEFLVILTAFLLR